MPDAYTVVIPAFNAERTLAAAIGSLAAQSRPPARILVVDDGSTDATAAIAHGLGVDCHSQPNQGPGAATNRGIEQVVTPLVAFLDADDLWLPQKAEDQLSLLAADLALDGVFGHMRLFRHGEVPHLDGAMREGWGRSTLMMRTGRARFVGPIYDPPGGYRGDMVDWISRARDLGVVFAMSPSVVALRRVIPGSLSYGRNDRDTGFLDVARRALARKRGLPPLEAGS
jgi:glycosyltransferase involved in cell wall biosynthesis